MPLMMGTTEECVKHFASNSASLGAKSLMAEFCGVDQQTVQDWVMGRQLPTGERITKLRIFLHLMGYRVSELDDLTRSVRSLCMVVALGLASSEDVRDQLGYRNVQDVYRVLRGESQPLKSKQLRINRILESTEAEVNKRLPSWKARIEEMCGEGVEVSPRPSPTARAVGQAALPEEAVLPVEVGSSATVACHLVAALNETFDAFGGESVLRKGFVDDVGRHNLQRLSSLLDDLLLSE